MALEKFKVRMVRTVREVHETNVKIMERTTRTIYEVEVLASTELEAQSWLAEHSYSVISHEYIVATEFSQKTTLKTK